MSQTQAFWRQALKASSALTVVSTLAAITLVGCPSGGVGDPCTPEDEYVGQFPGFTLQSAFIESRSFQCQTRVCLVNHFQGRVSCPNGQQKPKDCTSDSECAGEPGAQSCKVAGTAIRECNPRPCSELPEELQKDCNKGNENPTCKTAEGERRCNPEGRFCECEGPLDCPTGFRCDNSTKRCITSVCAPEPTTPEGQKRCYVPGTSIPISVPVCGQCDDNSKRDADQAVYCTCRCAPPKDNPSEADDNFNFCECPEGFVCAEINPNVGLGDAQLAGSYCIKAGTQYAEGDADCGKIATNPAEANCKGN
jgi:hypothetical protein